MSSLQQEIDQRGLEMFDLVDQNPESIFSKAGFYQRMMAFSMRDEHFKVQMFRFVDVLASLRSSRASWPLSGPGRRQSDRALKGRSANR
jgi:RHH-type proline utilization regulon transcriptional repressor/proline dehydrogenase/delta 1-pyrroline-5-carboxylate dehydrogenase